MNAVNSHALGLMHSLQLAQVVDNDDPDARGRIKIKMLATDLDLWASAIVSSAGNGYGVAMLPKVDEIVVVAFITHDQPLILGSIWAGANSVPEDADNIENKYVVRTPAGTVIELDDNDGPKAQIRTPQGYRITLTDGNGGEVAIVRGGQSITLNNSEVNVVSTTKVSVQATTVEVSAAQLTVNAAMSNFSGVVRADTVIASAAVVGTTYTPGAGNIW